MFFYGFSKGTVGPYLDGTSKRAASGALIGGEQRSIGVLGCIVRAEKFGEKFGENLKINQREWFYNHRGFSQRCWYFNTWYRETISEIEGSKDY